MNLPPNLTGVPPNIKRWADQVNDALRALRPSTSRSLRISESPSGWRAEVVERPSPTKGSQVSLNLTAFEIQDVSDGGEARVSIAPGLIRNVAATLNGTPLLDAPFQVVTEGTYEVYLEVDIDTNYRPTAVRAYVAAAAVPTPTDSLAILRLGVVTVDSGDNIAITQFRKGSQWYQACVTGTEEEPEVEHLFGLA